MVIGLTIANDSYVNRDNRYYETKIGEWIANPLPTMAANSIF